jgi:peroxidase
MGLTSIQTLFFREHNRIANELSSVNPQWDDERLFQEARRINIAIFQHIIYNEWLPTVIGLNNAALFDLTPLPTVSYFQGYDPNVNPQLSNEFASAAFRFGHTLVRNQYGRFNANGQPMSTPVVLSDLIFRPVEAYNAPAGGLESIFVGLFNEPARKFDSHLADTLQNHLFEFRLSDGSVIAIDLAATNINRGRDHGIPTYNDIRERCGFARARNFNDLANLMPINVANELGTIYE